jgi:hypothetical protein
LELGSRYWSNPSFSAPAYSAAPGLKIAAVERREARRPLGRTNRTTEALSSALHPPRLGEGQKDEGRARRPGSPGSEALTDNVLFDPQARLFAIVNLWLSHRPSSGAVQASLPRNGFAIRGPSSRYRKSACLEGNPECLAASAVSTASVSRARSDFAGLPD